MTTLSGLELRKAALLASGWTKRRMGGSWFWYTPAGSAYDDSFARSTEENLDLEVENLPAVELDAGISEPMFLEWCEKNGLAWTPVSQISERGHLAQYSCQVWQPFLDQPNSGTVIQVIGVNPSEARARAIVVAAAQEKK